jgi:hypothetical protein
VCKQLDYQLSASGREPTVLVRSNMDDWLSNLATLMRWSPYASEVELLKQVSKMGGSASSAFLSLLLESFSTDFWIGVSPLVSSSAIFFVLKNPTKELERIWVSIVCYSHAASIFLFFSCYSICV